MAEEANTILKTGTTVTTGASSSAAIAIPTNKGGTIRYVRAVALAGGGYVKFGSSAVTATANDILITTVPQILCVAGCTHFAHIQASSAQTINITPVEG